jgi:hypothetical protein
MRPKSMPSTRKKNGGLLASLHALVEEDRLRKKCVFPASSALELSITNSFIVANYKLRCNMKNNI